MVLIQNFEQYRDENLTAQEDVFVLQVEKVVNDGNMCLLAYQLQKEDY